VADAAGVKVLPMQKVPSPLEGVVKVRKLVFPLEKGDFVTL
jgi:hypothetical protein